MLAIESTGDATPEVTSPVDAAGNRLGIATSGGMNWLLPDPHGSVAAQLSAAETSVTNALRYDAWGEISTTGSGGGTAVGSGRFEAGR